MPDARLRLLTALTRVTLGLPPVLLRAVAPRPRVIDGQQLSRELQVLLLGRRLLRIPDFATLPIEQGRLEIAQLTTMVGGRQPIGATVDLEVDGATGPLPARLYVPTERLGFVSTPTLLFLHGGGWIYGGGHGTHDAACRFLAERSGVQLLAVDYRLAPEHPFPAAVEDSVAAFRWLVGHTDELDADPARLGVGGDSAGGNLAAVVATYAAREGLPLAGQLLVYPGTDFTAQTRSKQLFADEDLILTRAFIDAAIAAYRPPPTDPDASPLHADLPAGLAPAHVVTAGLDPLRDEGEDYAERLERAGVPVSLTRYPGLVHGFLHVVGAGRDCRGAVDDVAGRLRSLLG